MRTKHALHKSSIFVSIPILIAALLLGVLSAFYGYRTISIVSTAVFLIGLISRLWAYFATRSLIITSSISTRGVFPGNEAKVIVRIKNNKFLPVPWLELYIPLSKRLSLIPNETRTPDSWEVIQLSRINAATKVVGAKKCKHLLWYEEAILEIPLRASERGITSINNWQINTGDGFGLSESEIKIENGGFIAVYPKVIDINASIFLKNLWNANTGSKGVMEDISVIRSTRDYKTTDNLKHINWRLLSRGLPLTVNVYEDILPKSIHLILDGESFSGPKAHKDLLEETISVIASALIHLKDVDMKCFLSLPEGMGMKATTIEPNAGIEEALYALASYEPLEDKLDSAGTTLVQQDSVFNSDKIVKSSLSAGHFFYFTYDAEKLNDNNILYSLGDHKVTIISYEGEKTSDDFEVIQMERVKRNKQNG